MLAALGPAFSLQTAARTDSGRLSGSLRGVSEYAAHDSVKINLVRHRLFSVTGIRLRINGADCHREDESHSPSLPGRR